MSDSKDNVVYETEDIEEIMAEIEEKMVEILSKSYPDVIYIPSRMQYWNGNKLIPDQVIRDSYPDCYDIKLLRELAGWRISCMEKSSSIINTENKSSTK